MKLLHSYFDRISSLVILFLLFMCKVGLPCNLVHVADIEFEILYLYPALLKYIMNNYRDKSTSYNKALKVFTYAYILSV